MSVVQARGNWLFPMVLAIGLGAISFWLDRITEVKTVEIPLNPKEPKYRVEGISAQRFDQQGQLSETINAAAARQFPQQSVIYIDKPDMHLYKDGVDLYHITANQARYFTDSRKVDLMDDVSWHKNAVNNEPEGQLNTSLLHIDTQTQSARTNAPVKYQYGLSQGSSVGFKYDKQRGFLNLPARVKAIIYDPKKS